MLQSAGPTVLGSPQPHRPHIPQAATQPWHRSRPPVPLSGCGFPGFGQAGRLRPPLLSKLGPWADSVYPKGKCLMEKGKGQGQAPWGSAEEDTAPATLRLGFACRAGLWAGLGYPFCAT